MASEAAEPNLSQDMFEVSLYTENDGTVVAEIENVEYDCEFIDIEMRVLTTGEMFTERFESPGSWTHEYGFVRLVHYCGFDAASSEQIEGCEVPVTFDDDSWQLDHERLPFEPIWNRNEYATGVFRGAFTTLLFGLVSYGLSEFAPEFVVLPALLILIIVCAWAIINPVLKHREKVVKPLTEEDVLFRGQ